MFDDLTQKPKQSIKLIVGGGGGRGAQMMRAPVARYNNGSKRNVLERIIVDSAPAKASLAAEEDLKAGISSTAVEARIEEVLTHPQVLEPTDGRQVLMMAMDQPQSVASALTLTEPLQQIVLGYMVIRLPDQKMLGLRYALRPEEMHYKRQLIQLFSHLANSTARAGSSHVIGRHARSEHRHKEPLLRKFFAKHMEQNLNELVAGNAPTNYPIELTSDGEQAWPVIIRDQRGVNQWDDPKALTNSIFENEPIVLERGRDFTVCELTDEGTRLHQVRMRTDGRTTLKSSAAVPNRTISNERLHSVRDAISRADRQTVTRRNPLYSTD